MEHKFNASLATVFGLLTDPHWLQERSLAMGELSARCAVKKAAKGLQVTMQRRVHRDVNAVIAKVLNPDSDIEVEELWSGDAKLRTAAYQFTVLGKPISVTADIELEAAGKGCVYRINHTASVKIPFVGGVVEKFILGETRKACADELEYLASYLKQNKVA